MRKPCDIFAVAAKCKIRLHPMKDRYAGPLRPFDCFSRQALRRIGRKHGEGHLYLTLRLIVETEGNAAELYHETISGVSSLLATHPELAEWGLALFECFDRISLAEVRRHARVLAVNNRVQEAVAVLLALRLLDLDRPAMARAA